MNDSMRLVPDKWYRLYYAWILLLCVIILAGSVTTQIVPTFRTLGLNMGFTVSAGIIAAIIILYDLALYWFIRRKSQALAMVIDAMLFVFIVFNGLTNTDGTVYNWIYVGLWGWTTFWIGVFGLSILFGTVLFGGVYAAMQTDFFVQPINVQIAVIAIGTPLLVWPTYLFWRKRYIDPNAAELSQLSGKLQTNQEQSAILIQSIADGVIVTDTAGKINLMNGAAANMTGWTTEEAAGVDVKSVLKVATEKGEPIPEQEYPFSAVLVHKAFINQVLQLTSRKGRKQVVSLVISPVVTKSGEVFGAVAVMRDISEQRAAEQQRAEFISTASHEMRTPVAAIEGYLSLALNDKVSTIDSRARSFLDKAHASTEHLGKLFQDLLTSAKAEDGRLSSHPQVVEMGSFLEQLIEDLRFTAQKKNLLAEFVVGTTGDTIDATEERSSVKVVKPLYYVNADPERLREVITNLFDNAIKYTDQGKISVGLTGNTDVVQVYVRDTGSGIPAEDIPHLFQKFYRVDNSATRVIGGTGLGLFISRKIIELYNGRLWVESELGKGSTFFINLPRISAQKAATLQAQETAAPPVSTASTSSTKP